MALASTLHDSTRINFRGLLTHGGHSYNCVSPDEIREVASEERDAVVSFAAKLRRHGIAVPEISVGSTPTMMHVNHLDGVTEIRPGNYALFDGFQFAIGSCRAEDIAAHVLCSVIGVYVDRVILDAGALALSKDPGPVHVDPECGYGQILDLNRRPIHDLRLTGLSQEHGKAYGKGASRYTVGDKLLVVPNHSCLTMACFPEAHSIRDEDVVGTLRPIRGW
jgi:D-serine deaminase-like pyridoxal phosphate-dependent protein